MADKGRIFVSYASERRDLAEPIALALRSRGYTVFFDRDDLPAGQTYHDQIAAAMDASDLLVFLISPESVDKGRYTVSEVRLARKKWRTPQGRVLPIMVAPTPMEEIPAFLREVSFLETEGNLVADAGMEVDALFETIRKTEGRRRAGGLLRLGAGALVVAAVAGLGVVFGPQLAERFGLTEGAEDAPEERQLVRTPRLGLEFYQDGAPAPIEFIRDEDGPRDLIIATLERAPFEIRISDIHWDGPADDEPALKIAFSDTPDIFDYVRFYQDEQDTRMFSFGSAMAVTAFGDGTLLSAHETFDAAEPYYAHNVISEGRFNASGPGYRGVYVSSLEHRFDGADFLAGAEAVYLAFHLDMDGSDRDWENPPNLTPIEVELVELRFED
ncbi:MAG: toll/interleukin-1 receptor domain-containing protein [Pseudomonadota bacterium]